MSDIDASMRMIPEGEPMPPADQFWRCPKCGAEMGMLSPGRLISPKCGAGHKPVEMEQVLGWTER